MTLMDFNPVRSVVAHHNSQFSLVNVEFHGHIHTDSFEDGLCRAGELALQHEVAAFVFDQHQYHGGSINIMQWMEESWMPITYEQIVQRHGVFVIAVVSSHKSFGRDQTANLLRRLESSEQYPNLVWACFDRIEDARRYAMEAVPRSAQQTA